jgi:hypothetical protein
LKKKERAVSNGKKPPPLLKIKHFKNGKKDHESQRGFYVNTHLKTKYLNLSLTAMT